MIDIIITDTHFGWKNNSLTWLNYQMKFIYDELIPHIKKLNNVRVIHLGDVFDSRSTISTYVATKVVQAFKDIRSVCDEFIVVCGNHDFYSPNSDTVNTVKLFMNNMDIIIVDQDIYESDNHVYIPWYKWIDGIENGFNIGDGDIYTHADIFRDTIPLELSNRRIFSGHIHTPNIFKNRYNLGSTYVLNFADANQDRGYYVVDNDNVTFVPNKTSIKFYRLYNDEILNADLTKFNKDDYIELYVTENNLSKDNYITAIKSFTDEFSKVWTIPQSVTNTNTDTTEFTGYDIESIIDDMIPEDLNPFYLRIKSKINKID